MPAGVTTTSGNTGTCAGVTVTPTTITMAAGSTIPPGGCTIVVTITSSTPGTVTNTTGSLDHERRHRAAGERAAHGVGSGTASLAKTIAPSTIAPGGTATLTHHARQHERRAAHADRGLHRHDARRRDDDERQHRHLLGRHGDVDDDHDGDRLDDPAGRLHDRGDDHVVDAGHGDQHDRAADYQRRQRAARQRADHGVRRRASRRSPRRSRRQRSRPEATATLTITIGNAGATPLMLTAPFTDPMPAGHDDHVSGNTGTCAGVDRSRRR